MSPPRGRLGWLLRARRNRSGEVWSVRIPDVETPISITRYVRRDNASVERPVKARASSEAESGHSGLLDSEMELDGEEDDDDEDRDSCLYGSAAAAVAGSETGEPTEGVEFREGFPELGAVDQGTKRLRIIAPRARSKKRTAQEASAPSS
eukprot:2307617-Alexandrium_andersonii.AAC.1